eukprot:jgi/Undpi1/5410/HiC_scaffold_2.g00691.m1
MKDDGGDSLGASGRNIASKRPQRESATVASIHQREFLARATAVFCLKRALAKTSELPVLPLVRSPSAYFPQENPNVVPAATTPTATVTAQASPASQRGLEGSGSLKSFAGLEQASDTLQGDNGSVAGSEGGITPRGDHVDYSSATSGTGGVSTTARGDHVDYSSSLTSPVSAAAASPRPGMPTWESSATGVVARVGAGAGIGAAARAGAGSKVDGDADAKAEKELEYDSGLLPPAERGISTLQRALSRKEESIRRLDALAPKAPVHSREGSEDSGGSHSRRSSAADPERHFSQLSADLAVHSRRTSAEIEQQLYHAKLSETTAHVLRLSAETAAAAAAVSGKSTTPKKRSQRPTSSSRSMGGGLDALPDQDDVALDDEPSPGQLFRGKAFFKGGKSSGSLPPLSPPSTAGMSSSYGDGDYATPPPAHPPQQPPRPGWETAAKALGETVHGAELSEDSWKLDQQGAAAAVTAGGGNNRHEGRPGMPVKNEGGLGITAPSPSVGRDPSLGVTSPRASPPPASFTPSPPSYADVIGLEESGGKATDEAASGAAGGAVGLAHGTGSCRSVRGGIPPPLPPRPGVACPSPNDDVAVEARPTSAGDRKESSRTGDDVGALGVAGERASQAVSAEQSAGGKDSGGGGGKGGGIIQVGENFAGSAKSAAGSDAVAATAVDGGGHRTVTKDGGQGGDGDDEVQEGWDEVALLGPQARDEVSAITTAVAAATAGTAPEEKSTAPSLQNIATEACPNPSLDGAVRRIAHLLELLESVGEMEAWAKRVGGDGHSACRRLVDFAAAGGAGVLLSPGGVAVVASGFREERWAGKQGPPAGKLRAPLPAPVHLRVGVPRDDWKDQPGDFQQLLTRPDSTREFFQNLVDPRAEDSRPIGGGGDACYLSASTNGKDNASRGDTKLTRLLSLCADLAKAGSKDDVAVTGLDENAYFHGRGQGDEDGEEDGCGSGQLAKMALAVIYEILTGSCKGRVGGLRLWGGMKDLVLSLMDTVVHGVEGSYMMSTKALLAANDPFLRGVEAEPDPEPEAELWVSPKARPATAAITSAATIAKSTVVPALCSHPAKHEVQAAVLHILNEEGYPGGDQQLTRLCLRFCSDAFEVDHSDCLFYVNDVKVMVDVIVRELYNLPSSDPLRADYLLMLKSLLERSEWSTRGARYREDDIERATGANITIATTTTIVTSGIAVPPN